MAIADTTDHIRSIRTLLPLFCAGLLISLAASFMVHRQVRAQSVASFERDTATAVAEIEREIERHVDVIDDIVVFAEATWPGDLAEWRRYVDGRVTGGNYLAFTSTAGLVERVPAADVEAFEERERATTGEPFAIFELTPLDDDADRLVLTRTGAENVGGLAIRGLEVSSLVDFFTLGMPVTADGLQVGRLTEAPAAAAEALRVNEEDLAATGITSTDVLFIQAVGPVGEPPLGWVTAPAELGYLLSNAREELVGGDLNIKVRVIGDEAIPNAGTYMGTPGLREQDAAQRAVTTIGIDSWEWTISTWATADYRASGATQRAAGTFALGLAATLAAAFAIYRRSRQQQALAHAQFELSLQRSLAETDPLTALLNRQGLLARAERHVANGHTGCSVFFLDLDDFKAVNDEFGHATGDALLIAVAEQIRNTVRDEDSVARFGGDEFVIFAPGMSDETQAARMVNRLTYSIQSITRPVPISCSIGRETSTDTSDAHVLLDRADAKMYRAKKRNRAARRTLEPRLDELSS